MFGDIQNRAAFTSNCFSFLSMEIAGRFRCSIITEATSVLRRLGEIGTLVMMRLMAFYPALRRHPDHVEGLG